MEKSLLVTVSDDVSCFYGVRFVSSFFKEKSSMRITLFYVAPGAQLTGGASKGAQHGKGEAISEANRARGEKALESAKGLLCNRGFTADHVSCKLFIKEFGTVKDIIREVRKGNYDAAVLGRRGYTLFESVMANSVSKDIMDKNIDFPIWISRLPEEGRRNVLLCVDGSEPSLRMADHVGFMLKEEDHTITVFNVDTGERTDVPTILEEAQRILEGNGIEPGRIQSLSVRSQRIVRTIMDETDRRGFGVVAVGRAGVQKGTVKEWLMGSTSMKLLENLEKAVLWVSK
jgi:nucleotide-binding universal stress UspA family protein